MEVESFASLVLRESGIVKKLGFRMMFGFVQPTYVSLLRNISYFWAERPCGRHYSFKWRRLLFVWEEDILESLKGVILGVMRFGKEDV